MRPPAARAVAYGSLPLVVLAATTALEAGERASLGQALDGLKDSFGLSDLALGFLAAAMSIVGVLGAFPFGVLADRVKRTAMFGTSILVWTTCMGLNGLAPGYAPLFAARLGVGFVEANSMAAVSLVSDYYPVRERARRMGLYQAGALAGALVGFLLGGVAVAAGGWRWAFWMWIPAGLVVAVLVLRLPEPRRGDQDADFHEDVTAALPGGADAVHVTDSLALPDPPRVGTLDYDHATLSEIVRELFAIRSMWFGLMALTISSFLLNGLTFWAVEYFKRVHDLSAGQAGAFTGILLPASAVGIVGGGHLADRLLRRGILNARVYVVSFASIAATVFLVPAFLSTNLALTGVLLAVGSVFLTLPIAPGEAIVNDVVVAQLRGRANAFRSIVRSVAALSPVIIGVLSDLYGLRLAITSVVPLYALGGLLMLLAARTYPADLAFVGAEARRLRDPHRADV